MLYPVGFLVGGRLGVAVAARVTPRCQEGATTTRCTTRTMLMFPEAFLSQGGRLAVAVVARATSVPGGSEYRAPYHKTTRNIGVHGARVGVKLPRYNIAARVPPSSKGGRLAVVAAGTTSPGESDDGLPSEDCEAAVSVFRLEMEVFKMSQRPLALVSSPSEELIDGALGTAQDCTQMMEFLLRKVPIQRDTLKKLITIGKAFRIVEDQAKEGYIKAEALANAIDGVKVVSISFFEDVNLPEYSALMVPLSAEDIDKDSWFKEMIIVYIVLYTALYWQARDKYGFGK